MTASADTFQSLVASLAACGGELLRQLAVEHESEVKRLRCEIDLMQAHIGASTDFKLKIRAEAEKMSRKTKIPETRSPLTAKEQQRIRRYGRKREGKPDENALAKAFAFVDSHIDLGDSINDDRAFMSSIPEHDAEDTSRVLEVAAEIVDYVQQCQESTREPDSRVSSRRSAKDDVREIYPARGPPTRENANVLPSIPSASSRHLDSCQSMLQDNSGQIGIKLSSISPPIKAAGGMLDSPHTPEDKQMPSAVPDIYIEPQVLSERLNSGPSGRVHGSAAVAGLAPCADGESDLLPMRSLWSEDDVLTAEQSSASSVLAAEQTGVSGLSIKAEDMPLNTPRSPLTVELTEGASKPNTGGGTSPAPSREGTIFREDPLEEAERQRLFTLQRDGEAQATAASELQAEGVTTRAEEPAEDWRSLLQVHGAKWRPDGDDGVGIGMYLETPAAPSVKAISFVTPTSI